MSVSCETNRIAAYIDGELDHHEMQLFEDHVESCVSCRDELQAHRLFVCELDAAMMQSVPDIPVPAGFSRMVAARASSDMSGVRTFAEHQKALSICIILALGGFALVGATARDAIFSLAQTFVTSALGLAGFISTTLYDTVAGLSVIFKVISRKVLIESGSLGPMLVFFAVAILVLTRLISKYHRTGATE